MRALACLVWALCCLFLGDARADAAADRFVVVLKPVHLPVEDWPSGMRAVVSELVASGYELVVRSSLAADLASLQAELEVAASEPATVGALAVFRLDQLGTAYAYTPRTGLVSLSASGHPGTLAESELALRVAELLRDPAIPAAARPAPTPKRARPVAARAVPTEDRGELWLRAGVALDTDLAGPMPLVGIAGLSPHLGPLAVEAAFTLSPLAARVETALGAAELELRKLDGRLVFDPWSQRPWGLVLALGGGVLWAQASATADAALAGRSDETTVVLLSARVGAFTRAGPFRFLAFFEPGLMVPPLSVRASDREVVQLGRPWSELGLVLAWRP